MSGIQIAGIVIGSFLGLFFFSILIELFLHMFIKAKPTGYQCGRSDLKLLYYLVRRRRGEQPSDFELTDDVMRQLLAEPLAYVNSRCDCADFRANVLIRIYLDFGEELPLDLRASIKDSLIGFRYWMDQPGSDSMCYWSENHQIIFAVAEYIAGDMFPQEKFKVDGKLGNKHKKMAQARIEIWMEHRYKYGFSEWNSSNYYPESVEAMANFIQYSRDKFMVNRMKMILDLLMYDVAGNSFRYNDNGRIYYIYNAASARAYTDNKVSDELGNRMRMITDILVQPEVMRSLSDSDNNKNKYNCARLMLEAVDSNGQPFYTLPQVIKEVFNDDSGEIVVRSSSSLNTGELKANGLVGQSDKQIMFQFGMEAFTNHEVVCNSVRYLSRNKMFCNSFLSLFKHVNFTTLKITGLLPLISRKIAEYPNGSALQRANIYTYKCKYFSMSTVQNYHPEAFGAQQHIWSANINPQLSIFTTQPAKSLDKQGSPGYWVGNGRTPYSVQFKNVNITIYKVPGKAAVGEGETCKLTHAYCPLQYLDMKCLDYLEQGYMFGKAGQTFFMLKSNGSLRFRPLEDSIKNDESMRSKVNVEQVFTESYDLINDNNDHVHPLYSLHYWITDFGVEGITDKSFEAFIERMLKNTLTASTYFRNLEYTTTRKHIVINYKGSLIVNGREIDLDYPRFDSPYVESGEVERNPDYIKFCYKNSSLLLNYYENMREEESGVNES